MDIEAVKDAFNTIDVDATTYMKRARLALSAGLDLIYDDIRALKKNDPKRTAALEFIEEALPIIECAADEYFHAEQLIETTAKQLETALEYNQGN